MQNKNRNDRAEIDVRNTIGARLNFAAREAYKRLRTNLLFSFTGDANCRTIGVTSSIRGEGKSTTAVNLAYSLAEMGKRTLLVDADMRLSSVYRLLGVSQSPGLSNMLVGFQSDGENPFQASGMHKNLSVITAGDTPPNPTELLSSRRMSALIKMLSEKFEYIIIDLPPVDAVADALIVSKLVDGMVVVVRENYVDKRALDNTIRQLQYNDANILGFVANGSSVEGKYYKSKYYTKYSSSGGGYPAKAGQLRENP